MATARSFEVVIKCSGTGNLFCNCKRISSSALSTQMKRFWKS